MLADDWDGGALVERDTTLSFERALKVPGTEHMCNTALNQCLGHIRSYAQWSRKAKHVMVSSQSFVFGSLALYMF